MKKLITSGIAMILSAGFVFAAGVENKSNLSGGFLRNPSRNTENERPEAAFYNIAGTAFMKDGFYLEAGNQFVIKKYANELKTGNAYAGFGVNDYESYDDNSVYLYPDFDAVYKTGNFALFGTFGVYAGGGNLTFEKGTSATSLLFLNGAKQYQQKAVEAALAYNAAAQLVGGWQAVKQGIAASQGKDVSSISDAMAAAYASAQPAGSDAKKVYDQYYNSSNKANIDAVFAAGDQSVKIGTLAKASVDMAANHSLDVTSMTFGGQIGMAYRHPSCEWLSLSAAYRYTYGTQKMEIKYTGATPLMMAANGSNKITYEADGWGQSIVFGVHAKPEAVPGLDLSCQYQTLSRIEYAVDNVKGNVAPYYDIMNGKNFRTDLPAVLNLGAGYKVFDPLYMSFSFNYYFNDFAHQDNILGETDYANSWEVAYGIDYRFCKYVSASCGVNYGRQGIKDTSNSSFNPVLDAVVVGGGFEINPVEDLTLTLSGLYANYFDADYYLGGTKSESTKTVLSKDVTTLGVSVTYRFPVK